MGYTTSFTGSFLITPAMSIAQVNYINRFADTRRMKRDAVLAGGLKDPYRTSVSLPVGVEGAYFVGGSGLCGQDSDLSVLDYNNPPTGQPGLWCQWEVVCSETTGGASQHRLQWNGGEKFYYYTEWLEYLIAHFFAPWGHAVDGTVQWNGEDSSDVGRIVVTANSVKAIGGSVCFAEDSAQNSAQAFTGRLRWVVRGAHIDSARVLQQEVINNAGEAGVWIDVPTLKE